MHIKTNMNDDNDTNHSDIVDTINGPGPISNTGNGGHIGNANINLSNEASKATSDALTLRSVASTFPYAEPANANGLNGGLNGGYTYDPLPLVEDKWKGSGGLGPLTGNGHGGGSHPGQNGHNNGNLKRYNDNDHYLRSQYNITILQSQPYYSGI